MITIYPHLCAVRSSSAMRHPYPLNPSEIAIIMILLPDLSPPMYVIIARNKIEVNLFQNNLAGSKQTRPLED